MEAHGARERYTMTELGAITFDFNAADLISPGVVGVVAGLMLYVRKYIADLLRAQHKEAMAAALAVDKKVDLTIEQTTRTNGRVTELEQWKATQEGINKVVLAVIGDKPI